MLAPLLRLVSISLPLFRLPEPLWQGVVAATVLTAAAAAIRHLDLPPRPAIPSVRLLTLQTALAGLGLGIGLVGYLVLSPELPSPALGGSAMLVLLAGTLLLAAFGQELILRGIILQLAQPVFGRRAAAITFVALVGTTLQFGHGSVPNLVMVFVVGLTFGYLALRGGSVIGVVLAHGLANLMMFILLPQLGVEALVWLAAAGTAIGLMAAGAIYLFPERRPAEDAPAATSAARG